MPKILSAEEAYERYRCLVGRNVQYYHLNVEGARVLMARYSTICMSAPPATAGDWRSYLQKLLGRQARDLCDAGYSIPGDPTSWRVPDRDHTSVRVSSPELEAERNELRRELDTALSTLTLREAAIIRLRYGFDGYLLRPSEIAAMFDITVPRVYQIEAKAIRKLRHPKRSAALKDFLGLLDAPTIVSVFEDGYLVQEMH